MKKLLASFLCTAMICTAIVPSAMAATYKDIDLTIPETAPVQFVVEKGLMTGIAPDLFGPDTLLTRGMAVSILHRMENFPAVNYAMPYTDVNADAYYSEAIRWAASETIIADGNQFHPDASITREELMNLMWQYSQYKGYDVSAGEDTNILSYNDAFTITEGYFEAMQWGCAIGIISDDGKANLLPQDVINREQTAAILQTYAETCNV